jgi:hypothetical protein
MSHALPDSQCGPLMTQRPLPRSVCASCLTCTVSATESAQRRRATVQDPARHRPSAAGDERTVQHRPCPDRHTDLPPWPRHRHRMMGRHKTLNRRPTTLPDHFARAGLGRRRRFDFPCFPCACAQADWRNTSLGAARLCWRAMPGVVDAGKQQRTGMLAKLARADVDVLSAGCGPRTTELTLMQERRDASPRAPAPRGVPRGHAVASA